ncbi:HAD hydrolase-like protein [Methylophilaceae bacterium]|jgi:HAD superfamily hydrolase (TIGR01549 family)|nr:HAD hydrolase-like protein [Methylophilaceae bacterium]|tara:strand:- start:136 stop:786 length:651 start_codon:yes stop_codon:yes gene_type:complete
MNLNKYQTIIFDCDGVILNSNFQKIEAYRNTALTYGASKVQAEDLVNHHVKLTGISRYVKFKYFLKEIMGEDVKDSSMETLVNSLNKEVINLLKDCEVAEGLEKLKSQTQKSTWMVASGGDQEELRFLFKEKKITSYFDGGIYGSPSSKHQIIEKKLKDKNFLPTLFLGDSLYDIQTAQKFNLDFIFVYGWTDLKDWKKICDENNLIYVERIQDLT